MFFWWGGGSCPYTHAYEYGLERLGLVKVSVVLFFLGCMYAYIWVQGSGGLGPLGVSSSVKGHWGLEWVG